MRSTNILVRRRLAWVLLASVLVFFILLFRLVWIQFVQGEELKEKASETRMRDIPVEAHRGAILDRNGNELVASISVDSISAFPNQVKNKRKASKELSTVLDMDEELIYKKVTRKSAFEWIKRKVDAKVAREIQNLNIKGIKIVEESERCYLYDGFAAHLLGFTGVDNQGLLGLEKSFDDELRGKPGRIVIEHDAMGREIPEPMQDYQDPVPGNDLTLTLDKTIQFFVERELDKVVSEYDPKMAVGLVMDPDSGKILAMGNRPTFNCNNWKSISKETWDRNPAIWYNYEPGSTFKIITASSALEVGAVKPDDEFHDPGYISVADRKIRCWKSGGHGTQTFEEVVQNSCNPGFVEVGLELGKDRFYNYINKYGFGKRTGINLPGEARGIMIPNKNATKLNIATMAIGQSIAVTPIQLITAVSAAANGGKLIKPYLVDHINSHSGKTVKQFEPEIIRQVISTETSEKLRDLLEKVVSNGTGRNAFVEGYRVAGKTGTAQVVGDRGYVKGKYVSSFAGFAPADDPEVAILVMIAEPKGGKYFGGLVAAPVFQAIAKDTLKYLKIPEIPGLVKPKKNFWEVDPPKEKVEVPNVVNHTLVEAQQKLETLGLEVEICGKGNIVYYQVPQQGASVYKGTKVIINTVSSAVENQKKVTVPDLTGLSKDEAANILEKIDLYIEPEGDGVVVKQDIKPESRVPRGTFLKVKFSTTGEQEESNTEE
ncbi:MAG: stage V sporulation protein D [Clostridiales bacterium]|nr:stage V sporulation protein D [Clostridiales bacterium]MCF8021367.1 stage V sporulation protein D [Clostridiales bacterium]